MSQQETQNTGNGCQIRKQTFPRRFTTRLYELSMALSEAIEGIADADVRARYGSLLIYRLLFLYFLQHLGLLAGDPRYLQQRLQGSRERGSHGFYRDVLHPLFTGNDQVEHIPMDVTRLFTSRSIEQQYPALTIDDEVFTRIFALFDAYQWRADVQPSQEQQEITPNILGTLFADNSSVKSLGTYYTPDDVTSYIIRNTVIPAFVARTHEHTGEQDELGRLIWQQLTHHPKRFFFEAAYKGHHLPLPPEIAAGLQDVKQRQLWQKNAPDTYAVAGETWREVIARRAHMDEVLACCSLEPDDPVNLDRLVTWNVDQLGLILETLRTCQQPTLLEACYRSLRQLTILDPTCGSGAFLCMALQCLELLYIASLNRMEDLLSPLAAEPLTTSTRRAFQHAIEEAGNPLQRRATILQWIIGQNLYGVDLNEDAVEICRLRFALKVFTSTYPSHPVSLPHNFGQHIRVGNCLRGSLYINPGVEKPSLSTYDPTTFHWSEAFPEPMKRGGFDVVLGNPPYVEYRKVRPFYTLEGYTTLETGNLYALTMERSTHLLAPRGRFGMIVPSSATCTDGYRSLQKLLLAQQELHIASFSDQRGRLFALPHPRLSIVFYTKAPPGAAQTERVFTTPYLKLDQQSRTSLFERLYYTEVTFPLKTGAIPRYSSPLEPAIYEKLMGQASTLGDSFHAGGTYPVYYTRKLSWFVQVTPFIPRILDAQGQVRAPSELKTLRFASLTHAQIAFVALNSNLFYWLITTGSDCRNLNMREVMGLPLDLQGIQPELQQRLCQLAHELEDDLRANARMQSMAFAQQGRLTIQCLYPARSKHLIDEIDRLLACHYELSTEELDFLLHYDEKYRCTRTRR